MPVKRFAYNCLILLVFTLVAFGNRANAQPVAGTSRQVIALNTDWRFHFAADVRPQPQTINVTLPHTWNIPTLDNTPHGYLRSSGIYEKTFTADQHWTGKRLFLYFEGVNSAATVLVNNHFITEHKGGYTAFCAEITDWIKPGQPVKVEVQVSNTERTDVLPLCGDFNVYGGIHRPVSLLVTAKNCISPLDYASPGVYLTPGNISSQSATVKVLTKLSVQTRPKLVVKTDIFDAAHHLINTSSTAIQNQQTCRQQLTISRPHLWNGKADPYLYTTRVQLLENGKIIDEINQPLGLRSYRVDAAKGFMLNGNYLDLRGVGFHEDVAGKGSALVKADHDNDMQLILDLGANALRLTHYPHNQYVYDLADRNGLILWSEIPLVGPGGYTGYGYLKNKDLEAQARQVLTEMIRQNYNHPAICFWGLFNELKLDHDDPIPFLTELNTLAKREDASRLTTCATFIDGHQFNHVSDVIAWNKYYGWYGGAFDDIGTWADDTHKKYPTKPIAVSEYGAGGSPSQHIEVIAKPDAGGRFHPEEWEALFHEKNWEALNERPYIWGKFIWALADFGSAIRTEGDTDGVNDKGLVTYNRQIKKDAYYFYKANWNDVPMVYITSRRDTLRTQAITSVKVYANVNEVELSVNGKVIAKSNPDKLHVIKWANIKLCQGTNNIKIKAYTNGKLLQDSCKWILK